MTEQAPLSRLYIEDALRKALNRQEELTDQYRLDLDAAAIAEAEFKREFAISRVTHRTRTLFDGVKMNSDIADDLATKDTAELRMTMLTTAAHEAATRQSLLSVRTRLETLRTFAANYREVGA